MDSSAVLTILQLPNCYRFYLELPTQTINAGTRKNRAPTTLADQRTVDPILHAQLKDAINQVVEAFRTYNRTQGNGTSGSQTAIVQHQLTALGTLLYNLLLPDSVQWALNNLNSATSLILATDDSEIPWELLHDGDTFLVLKRSVGRQMFLPSSVSGGSPTLHSQRAYLLITNPTRDLPQTAEEGAKLMEMFDIAPQGIDAKLLGSSQATRIDVLQAFAEGNHALIHYSGHAEPSALLLADNKLSAAEIQDALRGHPFVFLNACRSGQQVAAPVELPYAGLTARNLAAAFLQGGASGFVGTLWPVFDVSSRDFAEWFYARLLDGESVGEALRQTRQQMIAAYPNDPLWASYVFYGDPNLRLTQERNGGKRTVTLLTVQRGVDKDNSLYTSSTQAPHLEAEISDRIATVAQRYGGVLCAAVQGIWQIGFGLTRTLEADSTHATRAAQEILHTLQAFQQDHSNELHQPLTVGIGISQGEIWLHSLQAASGQVEQLIGTPVEVSLTLAAKANAGEIWIDEATQRLVQRAYQCDPVSISGNPPIFRLGSARRITPTTALVGREEELADLGKWWREVIAGQGRLVGLAGDAGVGKSRLIQAFQEMVTLQTGTSPTLSQPSMRWMAVACPSHDQQVSLSLIAQLIRVLAQIESADDEQTQQAKLTTLISPLVQNNETRQQETLALLGHVLGLPVAVTWLDKLEPTQQQKQLANRLLELLRQQASQQPLLLVLEDLHLADNASLRILPQFLNHIAKLRILVLVSYRLGWSHTWEQPSHYRLLSLNELSSPARNTLLAALLPGGDVAQTLAEPILKLTYGNPFYIEAMIKYLQERGILVHAGDQWVLTRTPDATMLPPTIEELLRARLDTLDALRREVLEKAAVVGEQFEYLVLEAIEDAAGRNQLEDALDTLVRRELIDSGEGFRPEISYFFRHNLLQQAVYIKIGEQVRRPLHRLIAQVLVANKDKVERIAYHYQQSDDRIQAIVFGLRAAEHASSHWNHSAALQRYDATLTLLESLTSQPLNDQERHHEVNAAQRRYWKLNAYIGNGDVLTVLGQNDKAIRWYERALDLAEETDNPVACMADLYHKIAKAQQAKGDLVAAQATVGRGLRLVGPQKIAEAGRLYIWSSFLYFTQGRLGEALAPCNTGIAILEQLSTKSEILAQAYNLHGLLLHNEGQLKAAGASFAQSIEMYQASNHRPGLVRAYNNRAVLYQDQGDWNNALGDLAPASKLAEETGEAWWQAGSLINQAEIYRYQGEIAQAQAANQRALDIGEEHDLAEIMGLAQMNLGACFLKVGELIQAEEKLALAITLFAEHQSEHSEEAKGHLAELRTRQNQPELALQLAEEALQHCEETIQIGRLHRVLGRAHCQLQRFAEAREHLAQSLAALQLRNFRYELALTWLEWTLLYQTIASTTEDTDGNLHKQAIQVCEQAIASFTELGAKLDLAYALEIRQSL